MNHKIIYLFSIAILILLSSILLNGQAINSSNQKDLGTKRNAHYNIEEIKVRWKKAALENCPGVPCVTTSVPGAPTGVVATAGNATASVAFVAPTNNGGSAITGYTVTSNPGNITVTGATSPINVTGLTNNTAYTFKVVATNAVGNSLASSASAAVTPVAPNTVPGAPTAVVATAGNASASVSFVAPTNNGGSAITGYTVTSNPGGITVSGPTSPINVTGLTNNTAYSFTVFATNAVGNSVASSASTAVTPVAPNTVPDAPTAVVATAGNTTASVAFVAPTNNGGSAITGYTVTSNPGGITVSGPTSPINVTGLTNNTAYSFTVFATNAVGNSVASSASTAVTPVAPVVCPTPQVFDGSGNPYTTVVIGNQCWTKENLKATSYNDGITAIIDETANNANWPTLRYGARAEYVAVAGYVSTYGYLYNWYAVAGIITAGGAPDPTKNICPLGWHVPTDTDWTTLTNFLMTNEGGKLKSTATGTSTTEWLSPNTNANDQYGFSALPGGSRNGTNGVFASNKFTAFFWTASVDADPSRALLRSLLFNDGNVNRLNNYKEFGASVRCLRD